MLAEMATKQRIENDAKAMVDWERLICNFCRRRFNDRHTLAKHTEVSDMHASNLQEWRAAQHKQEAENKKEQ